MTGRARANRAAWGPKSIVLPRGLPLSMLRSMVETWEAMGDGKPQLVLHPEDAKRLEATR